MSKNNKYLNSIKKDEKRKRFMYKEFLAENDVEKLVIELFEKAFKAGAFDHKRDGKLIKAKEEEQLFLPFSHGKYEYMIGRRVRPELVKPAVPVNPVKNQILSALQQAQQSVERNKTANELVGRKVA